MKKHLVNILAMGYIVVLFIGLLEFANASDTAQLADANTQFGFKLLDELRKQDEDKDIFISPLSISLALAMAYNGAEGETKQAMAETLELAGLDLQAINGGYAELQRSLEDSDPKVELAIANSIWSRDDFSPKPDFLERNQEFFDAEVTFLPFNDEAVKVINQWVDSKTKGKIPDILTPPIPPLAVMYLINAVYFKGIWAIEFDKTETGVGNFYLPDGSQKPVAMMFRRGGYPYYQGEGFEAVKLSYGEGQVSMYIFLPDLDSNLNEFTETLTPENWERWLSQFAEKGEDSQIWMPRFKLELKYEGELKAALTALGMGIAFNPRANFSGIANDLYISKIIHKTFVEVNEEGTEAAAATLVEFVTTSIPSPPFSFVVDRPFFFAIHDAQTDTILFMGTVIEPDDPPDDVTKMAAMPATVSSKGKRSAAWGAIKRR